MGNEAYKVTYPLTSGTYNISGTSVLDDYFTLDSQNPAAEAGKGVTLYSQYLQNENGTLVYKVWDWGTSTRATYILPALNSSNAIEYINRLNSSTAIFDGLSKIKLDGDYSSSSDLRGHVFGSAGNDNLSGSNATGAVYNLYGGAGNDTVTGAAYYSILDGGSGNNILHAVSGTNYFRMFTGDSGTSTLIADKDASSFLQIYVNTTNAVNSTLLWDMKRVGDDLEGFVKDANGGTSNFIIKDQYTNHTVSNFSIMEPGTAGSYLGAGLTDAATGNYQIFAGTDQSDRVDLSTFSKTRAYVFGNGGDDTVISKDGVTLRFYNDIASDIDTVIYSGSHSAYTVTSTILASGTISTNVKPTGAAANDYLSNVDRLKFSDTMVGLDVGKGEHTGEVYRLYLTVLGRNPESDPVGCGFWIDKLDRDILNVEQMVGNFLNSTEFVTRFGGTTNTNESFVNLMYLNLLGRDGHPDSGFNFWLNVLNNHQASREQVVAGFMESPENISNAAPLIGDAPTYQQWAGS